MDKLISMTDFVLEQSKIVEESGNFLIFKESFYKIENYANFLKQPLQLGFFVPCDLDEFLHIVDGGLSREWKESKECVLFFGFEYDSKMEYWHNNEISFDKEYIQNKTIEDLVKYHLVLTESAKKQIGL